MDIAKKPTRFLDNRFVPSGWRVLPRFMLDWCAPTWGEKITKAKPQTRYIDLITGKYIRELPKDFRVTTSVPLLTPAATTTENRTQYLLDTFDLRVFAELLHLSKKYPHESNEDLVIKPSELVRGLGLELSGTSYEKVEQSLKSLAEFCIHFGKQRQFLLNKSDTGRIVTQDGITTLKEGKRRLYWRITYSSLIGQVGNFKTPFFSFPAKACKEAGRSQVAQWLTLFYYQHGHNSELVFDHNLHTLASKCYLPDHIIGRRELLISRREEDLKRKEAALQNAVTALKSLNTGDESYLSAKANVEAAKAAVRVAERGLVVARGAKLARKLDSLDIEARNKRSIAAATKTASYRIQKAFDRFKGLNLFSKSLLIPSEQIEKSKVRVHRYFSSIELLVSRFAPELRNKILTRNTYLTPIVRAYHFFSDPSLFKKLRFNPASKRKLFGSLQLNNSDPDPRLI